MILNSYDRMAIKNAAKACSHFNAKKQILVKKQEELQKQIDELDNTIVEYGKAVVEKTGYQPLDLVEKVGTTWVFKYPDTIIPPTENENKKEEKEEEKLEEKQGLGDKLIASQENETEATVRYYEGPASEDNEPQCDVAQENIETETEKEFVDPFNNLY